MKCFCSTVRVCRCFFWICCCCFLFGHSLMNSAHLMVLLWIWRAAWKLHCNVKPVFLWVSAAWRPPGVTPNQEEVQLGARLPAAPPSAGVWPVRRWGEPAEGLWDVLSSRCWLHTSSLFALFALGAMDCTSDEPPHWETLWCFLHVWELSLVLFVIYCVLW